MRPFSLCFALFECYKRNIIERFFARWPGVGPTRNYGAGEQVLQKMFPCCLRIGNNICTHLLHRIKMLPRCHTMTDAGLTRERTLCGVRNEMFRALSSDSYRLFYVTLLLLSVDL